MQVAHIASVIVGAMQVLATVVVAGVLYKQAQSLKRTELRSQAMQAHNTLNNAALANSENLRIFDSFGRQHIEEGEVTRRRRWCAFIWLQVLQNTFAAYKESMIDKAFAERALGQQLRVLLRDDLAYWLVVHRGFDPDFVKYCEDIRKEVEPDKPLDYDEIDAIHGLRGRDTSAQ